MPSTVGLPADLRPYAGMQNTLGEGWVNSEPCVNRHGDQRLLTEGHLLGVLENRRTPHKVPLRRLSIRDLMKAEERIERWSDYQLRILA